MTYDLALFHTDEITNLVPKSSGWLSYWQYLIRMTYGQYSMSSGWHMKLPWVIWMTLRILNPKSFRWVNYWQYLTRMTYGHYSMSSGWLTILLYVIRMRYCGETHDSGYCLKGLPSTQHFCSYETSCYCYTHSNCLLSFIHGELAFLIDMLVFVCLNFDYTQMIILMQWGLPMLLGICDRIISHNWRFVFLTPNRFLNDIINCHWSVPIWIKFQGIAYPIP